MDPAQFIPEYLRRYLCRMDLEDSLPAPGNYKVVFKVKYSIAIQESQCTEFLCLSLSICLVSLFV